MLYEINDRQKEIIQAALDAYDTEHAGGGNDVSLARAALERPVPRQVPAPPNHLLGDGAGQLALAIEDLYDKWFAAAERVLGHNLSLDDIHDEFDAEAALSEFMHEARDVQHFKKYIEGKLGQLLSGRTGVISWKKEVAADLTLDGYDDWRAGLGDAVMDQM